MPWRAVLPLVLLLALAPGERTGVGAPDKVWDAMCPCWREPAAPAEQPFPQPPPGPYAPSPPAAWDVLGPFPSGARELAADPLEAHGGIHALHRGGPETYPTDLVDGGRVGWRVAEAGPDGWVSVQFPEVRWEPLNEHHGWAGLLFQGWALGDFEVAEAGRYLARCLSTGSFAIDGQRVPGDRYGDGYAWFPVHLDAGRHTLSVRLGGFEGDRFNCSFRPVEGPLTVLPGDDTAPDWQGGHLMAPWVSVPVVNSSGGWLRGVRLAAPGHSLARAPAVDLAPGQAYPLRLRLASTIFQECPGALAVAVLADGHEPVSHEVSVRCREEGRSFKFTFLGVDGSVQYAAAHPPSEPCGSPCPVVLTTHGAGVRAEGQADAYRPLPGAWVLAPTGRRRFGYDWEGMGRQSALHALRSLAALSLSWSETHGYEAADMFRILFTGHSMGGHGAWSLASRWPDAALAAAPAAGWVKFQHYVPYFTRTGDSHADPMLRAILESSIAEHDNDLYAPNLAGIPVLARVGGDDESVPPWHLRRMARLVEEHGGVAAVSEIPGKGHWWGGVVQDEEMEAFFLAHLEAWPPLPERFEVVSLNPSSFAGRGGVKVHQHGIPFRVSRVRVDRTDPSLLRLETENARLIRLERSTPDRERALGEEAEAVVVDGTTIPASEADWLCFANGGWRACRPGPGRYERERGSTNHGPARRVLEAPLTIVYGTLAADGGARLAMATRMANDLYLRGRGIARVVADEDLTMEEARRGNLVVVGGPETNSWAGRLEGFPVAFDGREILVGGRRYGGASTGVLALGPWLREVEAEPGFLPGLALVLAGTDEGGLARALEWFPSASGTTVPDWLVAGPDSGWKGAGGLLATGFWGNSWEFLPVMSYLR